MARRTAKDILDSKKVRDNALTWESKKPENNAPDKKEVFDISEFEFTPPKITIKEPVRFRTMFLNTEAIVSDEEITKIKNSNILKI